MQEINLKLFNNDPIKDLDIELMNAFADQTLDALWKFEGISLICLKLERSQAIVMVKKIWTDYSFLFYKTLTSGTKRQSISVLYALVQMANLSSVIANDLIQNFNFNLNLKNSWTVSRSKCSHMIYPYEEYIKDYDTRSLFILFVCTLLRKSEPQARLGFLESNLISQIFPGLIKDTEYVQRIFFETLKKYVVDPEIIPRNVKLGIISLKNLEKISMLKEQYEFLIYVCTRPGHGVCYKDLGWYPPEKTGVILSGLNNRLKFIIKY